MKARILIYMAEGHLHPQVMRTTLKFGQMLAAASRAQDWVSNDVLDALYQAAMSKAKPAKEPFKQHQRAKAVRLLHKSGLVERGEGQARWAEDPSGQEAAMELATKIMAEDKARYKAAAAKARAEESLGEIAKA